MARPSRRAAPVTSTVRALDSVIGGQWSGGRTWNECNERGAETAGRAGGACGWVVAVRPLHGLALYAPGLGYYANAVAQVRRVAGVRQRFRHGARDEPAVRPRPGRAGARSARPDGYARTCGSSAPGPGRWPPNCCSRWEQGCAASPSWSCRPACASASRKPSGPSRDRVQWVNELPERMEGVVIGNEVLDAMPVKLLARKNLAWHERGVTRGAGPPRLVRRAHAPAPAAGARRHARLRDGDPPPRAGLHAHARRAAESGRGLLHRLRLSRGRVLPPAAPHGHADVPSRPPGRSRSPGRAGHEGHHRARRLHRHRGGCPGGGAWRSWASPPRAASS